MAGQALMQAQTEKIHKTRLEVTVARFEELTFWPVIEVVIIF